MSEVTQEQESPLPEVEEDEDKVDPTEQRRSFAVNAAVQLGLSSGQVDVGSVLDAADKIDRFLTTGGLPETD